MLLAAATHILPNNLSIVFISYFFKSLAQNRLDQLFLAQGRRGEK